MTKIFPSARTLDKYAWPGGYQIMYLVSTAGGHNFDTMCADCAQKELHEHAHESDPYWRVTADPFIHWEGPPEFCQGCSEWFESEYGDPDEEDPAKKHAFVTGKEG